LLLLSGILAEQVEEVAKCFQARYFKVVENRAEEEWHAILWRRKGIA
jgi:ribosomal protein L11 methylase PrmA